jgi:gamma-glutamyltranspeptidase/glutathione hydrolase
MSDCGTAVRRIVGATALLIVTAGCQTRDSSSDANAVVPSIPARMAPEFPAEWRHRPGHEAAHSASGVVASDMALASDVGVEILQRGGNAVDAAVATGFALAVTHPLAGNIGGGGFMVIRMSDGEVAALDYREVAPLAATRDMYLDAEGNRTDRMVNGHLAVAVPGSVAGLAAAHARFGRLPFADVVAPAIRLAEEGFALDSLSALALTFLGPTLSQAARDIFHPRDEPLQPGDRVVQPDLASTLRQIAAQGPRAFYEGGIADLIVAEMERGGGIISKEDLARYQPVWREPLHTTYRGYSMVMMPLPSSGGTAMTEILNILETFDALPPFHSTRYKHLLAESFRLAFVDRNTKLCDPAFCEPPVAQLISKEYARELSQRIDLDRASPSPPAVQAPAGMHTTHYSVVDGEGNAVSTTTTINAGFGSGVLVEGGGFFLNNEMDDFATVPGQPNIGGLIEGEQNAIEPGKRPLSSMSPTIVLNPAGEVLLVIGGAGGPTIITGALQVILNVIEHRMTLSDAMHAPRMHHQAWPDSIQYEEDGMASPVLDSLRAMGHMLMHVRALTVINAIMRAPGGWHGSAQPGLPGFPRPPGAAIGY